ncbi:rhomboid family intramembrane serine protease [Variovorax sp. DT-64]|uniref:rhomboid family intramembrane serine protease n=1 Tax=Variovorax sp. DT-64 TaxID=3396160 RepID=UPI003F1BECCE
MFYAIPLESRPSWRNPPWVTVLLILVNMLVFWGPQRAEDKAQQRAAPTHVQSSAPKQREQAQVPPPFTARWAQDHNPDAQSKPWTWVTSAFLHGSTGHLLGNMLFLFLFGFSVELALGRGLYLGFYLLGAVGASALAAWAYAGQGGYGIGASGAVSALMGMYAVMYRLRRIRFFYQLFFYFNYVTAPALILLPAWIANELLQHILGGKGIAYMAHLGGLLTGALLMAVAMRWRRVHLPEAPAEKEPDPFEQHVAAARRLAVEMKFEQACARWCAAAQLRPEDADTLRAWFNTARLWPAGEDFHHAARGIFRLKPQDPATLELQHASYKTYLDQAKPGARLRPEDMARLARRFTRAKQFADAERLCQALMKTAPGHPELAETVSLCANGLLQAGRRDQALDWLPHLLRLAPDDMVTRTLQKA